MATDVKEKTMKETGVVTDTSQKTDKEGQTEKNTQDKEGQTEKEDKPPDAGSERNRDYGAPPEFKGLDDLET